MDTLTKLLTASAATTATTEYAPTPAGPTNLALPPYLSPLPESDPRYAALEVSAYRYAYGPSPGDGMLKKFELVVFEQDHDAYRLFGGNSSACGHWWILAPPNADGCFDPALPPLTESQIFRDFAICPSWNAGTDLQRCTVPAGNVGIVGTGQSVVCQDEATGADTLVQPDPNALQLNAAVCSMTPLTSPPPTYEPTSSGNELDIVEADYVASSSSPPADDDLEEENGTCRSCDAVGDDLLSSTCVDACGGGGSRRRRRRNSRTGVATESAESFFLQIEMMSPFYASTEKISAS